MFKKKWNRKGQALVETAIVLPIILLVLLGLVEFGRIFNTYLVMNNASRAGARYAAVNTNDSAVITRVKSAAPTLKSSAMTINISPAGGSRVKGDPVTVRIYYNMDTVTPLGAIFPKPFTLTAVTVMQVE